MRTAWIVTIILFLILFTLVIMPPHLLGILFGWRISRYIPQLWHQVAFRLLRLKITIEGTPVRGEGVLYVSNHVSWVDIIVMGATLPASFVAKREVGTWPVRQTSGIESISASCSAVTTLVAPGPEVTRTTPGLPVERA